MKSQRPGILAARAVNQYRRRDVLTYLGLRYYLANASARTNVWATRVATDLAVTRGTSPYFNALNFKDVEQDGEIGHRSLHMPGANEALAEAALLAECARHPATFGNPDCVFCYTLASSDDRNGVFEPYVKGLRRRHEAVKNAGRSCPDGVVQYVDIKKFYPTITGELATEVWRRCCTQAGLRDDFAALGEKLIGDHVSVGRGSEHGILTGPMFSHLLANLVLHDLDKDLSANLTVRYFRYVDDIILVGEANQVDKSLNVVEAKLNGLGFKLHPEGSDKRLRVAVAEWLEGENDYRDPKTTHSWASLIGDLKRYLLVLNGDHGSLRKQFREAEFRIPVPDYTAMIYEADWLDRLKELAKRQWFRRKTRETSPEKLLKQAEWLRVHHQSEFEKLVAEVPDATGYRRKRLIPKLRYSAGRLVCLARRETLLEYANKALAISELYLHGRVMQAVATANVDELLPLGANAAQAAAQALAANGDVALVTPRKFSLAESQGLAILIMNGVQIVTNGVPLDDDTELMRLAQKGSDPGLMKSKDEFLRELACLHGLSKAPRHESMFQTAFDQDDDLVMDAIDQLQEYVSP
jgi:hypothetical protein